MYSPLLKALDEGRVLQLDSEDKNYALKLLCEKLESSIFFPKGFKIYEKILQRESQAVTYMGYGIACPHARADCGEEIICAIGWSPFGINYGSKNNEKVYIIFLYFIPEKLNSAYLNHIASLAKIISVDPDKDNIKNFKTIYEAKIKIRLWAQTILDRKDSSNVPINLGYAVQQQGLSRLIAPDISELLNEGKYSEVRAFISTLELHDIAELISELKPQQSILLFKFTPRNLASEIFSLLDPQIQNQLILNMANEETKQLISSLPPDDRTALFEELPANVTQKLLDLLNDQDRKDALRLLSYPRDSVGRLMTNKYVTIKPEWTAEQAIEHIRKTGNDSETTTMLYITDEKGILIDDIRLRKIILADPSTKISELLDGRFVALNSMQDREEAIKIFKKYDLFALPVVDKDGVLLGIVTSDDILDVSEEEATEDFHKSVAVSPLEEAYLKAPLYLIYRSRISWLILLVFINIFSGAGIAYFEELIASSIALVFFLPLLVDSAGNAGAQAATLVIRSMALGEIKLSDFIKVCSRELIVSLALGVSMSLAVFFLAYLRSGIKIAVVVAISMAIIVVAGSMIGMLLPFIFKKIKLDPAVASGPLVTSLADISGVLIYLSIASALLKYFGK